MSNSLTKIFVLAILLTSISYNIHCQSKVFVIGKVGSPTLISNLYNSPVSNVEITIIPGNVTVYSGKDGDFELAFTPRDNQDYHISFYHPNYCFELEEILITANSQIIELETIRLVSFVEIVALTSIMTDLSTYTITIDSLGDCYFRIAGLLGNMMFKNSQYELKLPQSIYNNLPNEILLALYRSEHETEVIRILKGKKMQIHSSPKEINYDFYKDYFESIHDTIIETVNIENLDEILKDLIAINKEIFSQTEKNQELYFTELRAPNHDNLDQNQKATIYELLVDYINSNDLSDKTKELLVHKISNNISFLHLKANVGLSGNFSLHPTFAINKSFGYELTNKLSIGPSLWIHSSYKKRNLENSTTFLDLQISTIGYTGGRIRGTFLTKIPLIADNYPNLLIGVSYEGMVQDLITNVDVENYEYHSIGFTSKWVSQDTSEGNQWIISLSGHGAKTNSFFYHSLYDKYEEDRVKRDKKIGFNKISFQTAFSPYDKNLLNNFVFQVEISAHLVNKYNDNLPTYSEYNRFKKRIGFLMGGAIFFKF